MESSSADSRTSYSQLSETELADAHRELAVEITQRRKSYKEQKDALMQEIRRLEVEAHALGETFAPVLNASLDSYWGSDIPF